MNYCNFPHWLKSTTLWEQAGAVRTSSRSEPSSEPHICALVIRCLSTAAGDASDTWAPSLPTSSFLNFSQDCQYGARGRAGSHRVTGRRASLGAVQSEEVCLHPKARQVPESTIFLKKYYFSMKLLHGCEWYSSTIMRIFKHEEKPNTSIHPPKYLKFKTEKNEYWHGCEANRNFISCFWERKLVQPLWKTGIIYESWIYAYSLWLPAYSSELTEFTHIFPKSCMQNHSPQHCSQSPRTGYNPNAHHQENRIFLG